MKKNTLKLVISVFVVFLLTFTAFGQSKFRSGPVGGHRATVTTRTQSPNNFRQNAAPMGQGRQVAPVQRQPSVNRTQPIQRMQSNTNRISYRTSYRVGYRPPLSVHFFGNPYMWGGHSVYWYGGGYYSLFPGGPLILGNSLMPGYQAAYGYDPSYTNATVVSNGQPVVVVRQPMNPMWYILGFGVLLLFIVIIIKAL